MSSAGSGRSEFGPGWTLVMAGLIGMACGLTAMPFYVLGTFTRPLGEEFHWSRAELHGAVSVISVGMIVMSPIAGLLIDRYGFRRVALMSYAAFAVAMASVGAFTHSIESYYALILLVSLVGAGTGPLTWSRGIVAWFTRRPGLALGIVFSGAGLFSAFGPSYATWLIDEFGWRWAFAGLAILPAFLGLPLAFAFLRRPSETGEQAMSAARAAGRIGIDARDALAGYRLWTIGLGLFVVSFGVGGMSSHLIPMLTDSGLSPEQAAWLASFLGLSMIAGRVGAGLLADRFWAPAVAAIMFLLPVASCFTLTAPGANAATATAIVLIGLAAGADVSMLAFLTNRYFGRRAYGLLSGIGFAFFALGTGSGSLVFGWLYDRAHSYGGALHLGALCFGLGSLIFPTLRRYPVFAPDTVGQAP